MDSATEDLGMADTSVPDAGPTLTPCASNVECAGGEVCRTGFCRTSCSSASECTGALSVCDEDAGYCVGCTLDEHCGANEACVDRTCEFFCRGNAACDADEYCVLATGACAERECELSNQCPGGFRCDAFLCVPIDDIVCVADSVTCSGGNTAVLRCNADGTMEAMEACDVDTRCVAEAGAATCDAILCEANELGCADNATAFVCDATGTVRTDTDCGAGRYCASGACQDQVCTPSSVSCMGAGVLSCDALGAAETFEACSARAECSGSSFGCSCASGSCMTRVCVPASTRCAVTGFQTCAADGLSWGNVTGCAMDETCVPALGTCAPVLCTANSRECMTDVLVACDATGTVRTTTNCAASSQICTGSGPSAACTARVCVPGSLACNAGFDSVLECDARGASLSSTACPSGDYCSAGGCVAEVCTPGSLSRCLGGRRAAVQRDWQRVPAHGRLHRQRDLRGERQRRRVRGARLHAERGELHRRRPGELRGQRAEPEHHGLSVRHELLQRGGVSAVGVHAGVRGLHGDRRDGHCGDLRRTRGRPYPDHVRRDARVRRGRHGMQQRPVWWDVRNGRVLQRQHVLHPDVRRGRLVRRVM
ncbi:MAG: hypothetical protein IPI43_31775 [Sandaracinaceae bacterium]|nr:hypothetical protein [Sandaracinaceae bacterium]